MIGILGCAQWPDIGYRFHPGYARQGYATEALQAFLPSLFAVMPACCSSSSSSFPSGTVDGVADAGQGYDYAQAFCDVENVASIRLLERCGFTRGEVLEGDYESPLLGLRDAVRFRIARPGTRLKDATAVGGDEPPPVPDLQ